MQHSTMSTYKICRGWEIWGLTGKCLTQRSEALWFGLQWMWTKGVWEALRSVVGPDASLLLSEKDGYKLGGTWKLVRALLSPFSAVCRGCGLRFQRTAASNHQAVLGKAGSCGFCGLCRASRLYQLKICRCYFEKQLDMSNCSLLPLGFSASWS